MENIKDKLLTAEEQYRPVRFDYRAKDGGIRHRIGYVHMVNDNIVIMDDAAVGGFRTSILANIVSAVTWIN